MIPGGGAITKFDWQRNRLANDALDEAFKTSIANAFVNFNANIAADNQETGPLQRFERQMHEIAAAFAAAKETIAKVWPC